MIPRKPILIVDDDANNRDLLSRRLTRCGYATTVAASGEEALAHLSAHAVSMVLLDVQMPGMSGIEVLQTIRRRWSDVELPVLMVTAKDQSEDIATALDLGASDYITKPIDFRVGLARIRSQLERRDVEARVRVSEERYALAARGANDGLWDWDLTTGRVYYSSRWKTILGHEDNHVGDGPDEWFGRVHGEDLPRLHCELEEHFAGRTEHFEREHRIRHKTGQFRWVLARGATIRDREGRPVRMAGSLADVTNSKIVDGLTGLPNRLLVIDRLDRMFRGRRHSDRRHFAVLFFDLDGFKLINDGLGHVFGDNLLQTVARRLGQCLRGSDVVSHVANAPGRDAVADHTIGRVGGDEFVVILHDMTSVVDATRVADRIHEALSAPFDLDGRQVFTTASIGIAFDSANHTGPEDVLRDADTAMYRAKALGKGRSEVFDATMREEVVERIRLNTALRVAVERYEFVPFFQPIVDLRTGRLTGLEALVRWRHPEKGIVPPSEFISVLQENRLIVPVGRRFFADVCALLRDWQRLYPHASDLSVNVNFAGPQFNEIDLLDQLLETLDDSQLRPDQLVVEITEATAINDFDHAVDVLGRIRAAGFRISLDDFGTGYSALSCLHELPITGLKLDRSFIARELGHPAIVKAIIVLADQLGLTVTAEGIETEKQYEQLRGYGCMFGQGYLFGHPMDAQATADLIASQVDWRLPASAGTVEAEEIPVMRR